ncbi:MAG: hypothetical protein K2X57_12940 [Xanthobacteraceae bacterium]|nr:hypothetical protein [Xanthobacteraceae bacterium]
MHRTGGGRFYLDAIAPTREARETAENNKALLDAIQSSALQLSNIIREVNDYALFHANDIVAAINSIRTSLKPIPIANKLLDLEQFQKADKFARSVKSYVDKSRTVIAEVEQAISKFDPEMLQRRLKELAGVQSYIEGHLNASIAAE